MLQNLSDRLRGKKFQAWFILISLGLTFVMWGSTGRVNLDFGDSRPWAARVNGERIDRREVEDAWRNRQSEWQQQSGVDMPEDVRVKLQDELIEGYVRNQLLTDRAHSAGYRVTADRVQGYIRSLPAFQIEGQYNETLALSRLAQLGIAADKFRMDVRRTLANQELTRAVQVSEFMTPAEIGRRLSLEDEQREVQIAKLPIARYAAAVAVEETALAKWYGEHAPQFLTPESVKLQYAELSLAEISRAVSVTDADVQEAYAKNKAQYAVAEKRRARHILLADEKSANEVLARLKKGEDFATLAKQLSKDPGSGSQGGDLGWSERTAFVAPFADAVFAMKEGELRGPVKSEFGYHVIRLEGIQAERTKSFEESRADIETELKRDRAADAFGEREEKIARRLETPGAEFDVLVKETGLTAGEIATFTKQTGGAPLGAEPDLLSLVFGDAVLNQRKIGGPIALGDERFAIVRVLEHRKPVLPAIDTVRALVTERYRIERGTAAAKAAAEAAAAKIENGKPQGNAAVQQALAATGLAIEAARYVDRRDPSLDAALRGVAFKLARPKDGVARAAAVSLPDGSAAVVVVSATRAVPPAGDDAQRSTRLQQLKLASAQASLNAYVEELRRTAKVERNPQALQ